MTSSGIISEILAKGGNERYEYFFAMDNQESVLLIDQWRDQSALDAHRELETLQIIVRLRDKYDLHMRVERFISDETNASADKENIRK